MFFLKLLCPKNGELIELHTEIQKNRLADKKFSNEPGKKIDWLDLHKEGEDRSFSKSIVFSWEDDCAGGYVFELCENENFCNPLMRECTKPYTEINNLYIGRTYFWRVRTADECSETYRFETEASAPRFITVEGVSNVRDIGGWNLCGGGKIKQGLVIRGGEMEIHQNITENGLKTMKEVLKIKTDFDLRAPGFVSESALGKDKLLLIPIKAYSEFFDDEKSARKVFEVFQNEENYPIYIHCWGGADRTGTVIFILEAILGMSREDLFCDYELTSLGIWGVRTVNIDTFENFLNRLSEYGEKGDSINVLCEKFLKKIGLTDVGIKQIRNILTEK